MNIFKSISYITENRNIYYIQSATPRNLDVLLCADLLNIKLNCYPLYKKRISLRCACVCIFISGPRNKVCSVSKKNTFPGKNLE